ncbi:Abi-alpha family protein [Amycolatopsis taiwanensis]|nr:Abi-alpha family protein [Amycolatopsis taiwanensis]
MAGEEQSVLRRAARLVGEILVRPAVSRVGRAEQPARVMSDPLLSENGTNGSLMPPLRVAMKELLDSSADADRRQARDELYAAVLRQLTADEARILAVLARGAPFPVVDVVTRQATLLRNASTVGEAAGVTLRDEVPSYLTRLIGLGLVEREGVRAELEPQYEILATDGLVREAAASGRRARLVRGTVRLSPFGSRFWAACDPEKSRAR